MKFGREKYEVIQDTSIGKALAALVLACFRAGARTNDGKVEYARELARGVLGIDENSPEPLVEEVQDHMAKKLKIPHDEPVFLIRAKDKNALEAIDVWINTSIDTGVDSGLIHEARIQRRRIEEWQRKHHTRNAT
jgi:hypothetical protein